MMQGGLCVIGGVCSRRGRQTCNIRWKPTLPRVFKKRIQLQITPTIHGRLSIERSPFTVQSNQTCPCRLVCKDPVQIAHPSPMPYTQISRSLRLPNLEYLVSPLSVHTQDWSSLSCFSIPVMTLNSRKYSLRTIAIIVKDRSNMTDIYLLCPSWWKTVGLQIFIDVTLLNLGIKS